MSKLWAGFLCPCSRRVTFCLSVCSDWDSIPQHLLEIILEKVAAEIGMTSLLSTRLVSKNWNAAFKDYSRTGTLNVQGDNDLAGLINIMPNISSLAIHIDSTGREVALSPLSGCKQLTCLQLRHDHTNRCSEGTFTGISHLPATLKILSLDRAYAPPESFTGTEFPGVTRLEYLVARHRDGSTCIVSELLQSLPSLKVNFLPLLPCFPHPLLSQTYPRISQPHEQC